MHEGQPLCVGRPPMVRHDRGAVLIRVAALIINFTLWGLAVFVVLELASEQHLTSKRAAIVL